MPLRNRIMNEIRQPMRHRVSYIDRGVWPVHVHGLSKITISILTESNLRVLFRTFLSSMRVCKAILTDYLSANNANNTPHK